MVVCWPCPSTAAPDAGTPITEKALLKKAARLAREVRLQRQLKPRRKYKMEVLDREALAGRRLALLEARFEPGPMAAKAQILATLGLVDPGTDLRAVLLKRLTAGEPGPFYDPQKQKIYIAGGISFKDQRLALALATCHALLDQRFRLRRLREKAGASEDAYLAVRALAEGDCATLILELLLADDALEPSALGKAGEALFARAIQGEGRVSDFLQRRLLFPYMGGLAFVSKLRSRYPWALMRKAYKRPPESTEQVMHYERYWDRDRPDRFRAPGLKTLEGATELRRDTLGEFVLGRYLTRGVDEAGASRAAQGWGGDLLLALKQAEKERPLVLIHLTSWDSDLDTREYAAAQAHLLLARELKPEPTGKAGLWRYTSRDGAVWSQRIIGQRVLTLMGVPAEQWETLEAEIRKRWRVNGRRLR